MATWELFRDGVKEQDLINVQYIDSANPFGDYVILQIEDNLGQKFDLFEYATEIEVTVTPEGGSQISKFTGFVVERRENDQQGQDVLEVEAYSFDQFLRQNDVSNDQSGKLISDAIEDIVKTDTPVSFNASKVNVVDDFELRRSLQDERVETALQILSFESGNEGFGVDDTLEFFFRPRERNTISRGIDNTQWFNYDIPERGKEAVNEVEVRFDDGDRSAVVDKPSQKLEIQESLNLPEPATQRARISRPSLTNTQDAETEGRRFLELKNVTLTGTITTFGLFEAKPFDTISAEIIPRGIDSEFIITQIEYNWGRDETTLTIVENRGFQEDLFVRLAEKTERIDLRETDPQSVEDRIISANVAADVTTEITVAGQTLTSTTTNDGVDKIVTGWRDNGNPTIQEIVVGDKATELSRSDSDLENQITSSFAFQLLPTSKSVKFRTTVDQNNVKEIGLKDAASGTLISRGIFDTSVNLFGIIEVTLTVSDASDNNSVVTDTGQTAIRDIIADNNPLTPTRYAFGSNQSQPAESDTSLTNRVQSTNLNRTPLQIIDTASEFEDSLSIASDKPVSIDQVNDAVTLDPVTYYTEAENANNLQGNIFQSTATLSNDFGITIGQFGNFVEFEFTINQDIPPGQLRLGTYAELSNWSGTVDYSFDNSRYRRVRRNNVSNQNSVEGFSGTLTVNARRLLAGTTHRFRVETAAANQGSHVVDAMFAFDGRNKFAIQPPASSAFNGDTYEFPELFPKESTISFAQATSRRNVTEVELVQTWNDTSNNASVTLNLGSQSRTVNNPNLNQNGRIRESLTLPTSNTSRTASVDITLSRINNTSASSEIPRLGDGTQRMSFHVFDGDPSAINRSNIGEAITRGLFERGTLASTLRESGQSTGGNLLTHSVFADVEPDNDNIISSEQITFIPK